jgi:hypothetical protein
MMDNQLVYNHVVGSQHRGFFSLLFFPIL